MRSIIIWLGIFCFGFLFGCQAEQEQEKKFKVGFSQPIMKDAWRQAMYNEMQRQLIFHDEIELIFKDGDSQTSIQIAQILQMVEEGIDLLIVSPNEAAPLQPIIESVFEQGIPVIILDRRINSSKYTAYIGADNKLIGNAGGKYIARLLNGRGKVLEVYESLKITAFSDRHFGFREVMVGHPQIQIDSVKAIAKGESKYRELIANEQYDVVFAATDVAAKFAYDVAQEAYPEGRNKYYIGIDALPGTGNGLEMVENGILTASIIYPTGGDLSIDIASRILNGEPYEKENILQTLVVDSTNVKIIQTQARKILDQQTDILSLSDKLGVIQRVFKTQRTLTYLFALTMVISIIMTASVLKSLVEKRRINNELQSKNEQITQYAQQAEEATQAKFRFFTNISHEFRTPLTLIKAPVDELLERKEASLFKKDLKLIRKNTLRLLRLVNQIMDFRKIDNSKMNLRINEQPLIPFLKEIMDSFEKLAGDKQITFKLIHDNDQVKLWFDGNMMDKVFFNLLSNAFKFTNKGGSIFIRVETNQLSDEVRISVDDTGNGMTEEQVTHIFDRFYQGDQYRSLGTGLGLALSKEIIDLHKGSIEVESIPNKGTRFVIKLKTGKDHLDESMLALEEGLYLRSDESLFPADYESTEEPLIREKSEDGRGSILLIEDNDELRAYLKGRLGRDYFVMEANNVVEGIEMAMNEVPDLIVCDLMLKHESGYEVIRALKEDLRSSHIPIVILTAKSSTEEKIKGIRLGADDYITKPFDVAILCERIRTLLANRQKLREHFLHELPVDQKGVSNSRIDKKFVSEFTALVEANLADAGFGVNEIGHELGLSRMQLYRKVKALLGYSVNDYISNVRLKKAKHLILEGEHNISEIAHIVGFSTASYFSTAFKNQFGMTPSEFKSNHES